MSERNIDLLAFNRKCNIGDCSFLDNLTCLLTERPDNLSGGELRVDQEGCFSTNQLRTTALFQHYRMVWMLENWRLILTLYLLHVHMRRKWNPLYFNACNIKPLKIQYHVYLIPNYMNFYPGVLINSYFAYLTNIPLGSC